MSIWDYNIKAILLDLVTFKIHLGTIKAMLRIIKLVQTIDKNNINVKTLLKFKPDDIRVALKFHNKYIVKGEKFDAATVFAKINTSIVALNNAKEKYPEIASVISALVTKRLK